MIKSFKELEETNTPDPNDVIDTMEDYAKSGAAISGRVVVDVINKAGLSRDALEACLSSATKGKEVHKVMSGRGKGEIGKPEAEQRAAREYEIVASHIRQLLAVA